MDQGFLLQTTESTSSYYKENGFNQRVLTVSRKATQAWQLPIGIVELKIARPEEMRNQSLKEWFSKCVLRPAGSASTGHLVEIQILRLHRRQQH